MFSAKQADVGRLVWLEGTGGGAPLCGVIARVTDKTAWVGPCDAGGRLLQDLAVEHDSGEMYKTKLLALKAMVRAHMERVDHHTSMIDRYRHMAAECRRSARGGR